MSPSTPFVFVLLPVFGALAGCSDSAEEPRVVRHTRTELPTRDGVVFPVDASGKINPELIAEFQFDDVSYNFGRVREGTVVQRRFSFTNTGAQPLLISHAESTCGCTVPQYPRSSVAPGDTASILVTFDTRGKVGKQQKPVILTANTFPNQSKLYLTGEVYTSEEE